MTEHATGEKRARGHEKHCFIAMPYGRDAAEIKHFKGWYQAVIEPAIKTAGLEPILIAAEEKPNAINDDIRTHLAFDAMAVIDLGGAKPESDPNPNVMYELGLRHALNLPLVLMAFKGQRLPFDVANQKFIAEERDLADIETNKSKLVSFIKAAEEGEFYRPMDAVGRAATLAAAEQAPATSEVLRALVAEVASLRERVESIPVPAPNIYGFPHPWVLGSAPESLASIVRLWADATLRDFPDSPQARAIREIRSGNPPANPPGVAPPMPKPPLS